MFDLSGINGLEQNERVWAEQRHRQTWNFHVNRVYSTLYNEPLVDDDPNATTALYNDGIGAGQAAEMIRQRQAHTRAAQNPLVVVTK